MTLFLTTGLTGRFSIMTRTLREELSAEIEQAVKDYAGAENIELPGTFSARVEYPPEKKMGQYASPVAMELARVFKKNPRQIAAEIESRLEAGELYKSSIEKMSIEGPGFLNFYLNNNALRMFFSPEFNASEWLADNAAVKEKEPRKILFEFVSANPTGPLNIVSARAAAVGDSICRVLSAVGHDVSPEYYVNDFGNQVKLLGESFAYRYAQSIGIDCELPENAYRGEYIIEFTEKIAAEYELPDHIKNVSSDSFNEEWVQEAGRFFAGPAIDELTATQRSDLNNFRVHFDRFFSEATLHESNEVSDVFTVLEKKGVLYEKDNAVYFRSTDYGDDKDRVVRRSDGRPTYLLADIAYHRNKVNRGFHEIYDIWGPDHHGYIARLSGAMQALGFATGSEKEKFQVLIVQQVNMLENGKPVVMSKRLGQFQTMRDLIDKIPVDVSRYFFVARAQSSHLDFDLELALTENQNNPVYYIQYAHARIHSIFKQVSAEPAGRIAFDEAWLENEERRELLTAMLRFKEEVLDISENLEVHRLPAYLYDLASLFTSFYHSRDNVLVELKESDPQQAEFLLVILKNTAEILRTGLELLGISAPESM